MATNFRIPEPAFRIGCGRYIQQSGAVALIGEELARLGVHRAFLLGSKTALALTEESIANALEKAGISAVWHKYNTFCNPELCEQIRQSGAFADCDGVVGIGGGNCMDMAKLLAVSSALPVVNIPTSSATCAACTPLSVLYNRNFQTIGTRHHKTEVSAVLVDMDILCRQPVRLLVAGVYDALAKKIELQQRLKDVPECDIDIGSRSAAVMSDFLYDRLLADLPEAVSDTREGKNTKAVYDIVYLSIALTGVVSGLARGSNQCAVAHKIYELSRTFFPAEVRYTLHGELVAVGLLLQLAYNGECAEEIERFRATMKQCGMPVTLAEAGVPVTDDLREKYYTALLDTSAMRGATEHDCTRLYQTLGEIL